MNYYEMCRQAQIDVNELCKEGEDTDQIIWVVSGKYGLSDKAILKMIDKWGKWIDRSFDGGDVEKRKEKKEVLKNDDKPEPHANG